MDQFLKFALLILLLSGVACTTVNATTTNENFEHCEKRVKKWAFSALSSDVKEDKHILKDLLFFLHVPRTGGRAYYHCFLRILYPGPYECPHSYDKFRFNRSKTDCRLLSSHDDYSVMSKLPSDRTSVVTILRNPIDRFFSTYEFSIEVAARFLIHPNLTSATRMSARVRSKTKGVSTLDIWPWKYLVPWMREDLFTRRETGKRKGSAFTKNNDPYSMEDIIMPLTEYIHHPIALDIVHNGATFQVAGLTNNSNIRESHEVRQCVIKYQSLGDHVLEVAKKRLDNMLYVGLTENHNESASLFANVVGAQVISQLMETNLRTELPATNQSAQNKSSFPDSKSKTSFHQNFSSPLKENNVASTDNIQKTNKTMTVESLHEAYKNCVSNLRGAQGNRRNTSFAKIPSVNFTKEARLRVSKLILQEIASLNSLDVQLYKHAQDIFAKEHKHMVRKMVNSDTRRSNSVYQFDAPSWRTFTLATVLVLFFIIFLLVNARRRISKLKMKL